MRTRRLSLLLVVAATSVAAERAPGSLQLALGINGAPLVNHLGLLTNATYALWSWRAGELTVGVQTAVHFYLPNPSARAQPGTSLISNSFSFRPSVVFGHETLFARRFRLGLHVWGGPHFRFIDASLRDERNRISAEYHHLAMVLEVGGMLTAGWKFTDSLGVDATLAVPLAATGSNSVLQAWLVVPPSLGLSARLFF